MVLARKHTNISKEKSILSVHLSLIEELNKRKELLLLLLEERTDRQ